MLPSILWHGNSNKDYFYLFLNYYQMVSDSRHLMENATLRKILQFLCFAIYFKSILIGQMAWRKLFQRYRHKWVYQVKMKRINILTFDDWHQLTVHDKMLLTSCKKIAQPNISPH